MEAISQEREDFTGGSLEREGGVKIPVFPRCSVPKELTTPKHKSIIFQVHYEGKE